MCLCVYVCVCLVGLPWPWCVINCSRTCWNKILIYRNLVKWKKLRRNNYNTFFCRVNVNVNTRYNIEKLNKRSENLWKSLSWFVNRTINFFFIKFGYLLGSNFLLCIPCSMFGWGAKLVKVDYIALNLKLVYWQTVEKR